ncbi:glucosamine-6-phosphate deaminase [Asaia lannensis]|uniref:Glucosamine-6-phosphate deaminase n=1 Tax=Asaia lannensis NBRC 102526 TaxID=1307926 RepID=A0ABT1CJW8_9PROT|nr:glucosamine-6-phosphate deaminase [Asaia lannensis]MCO6161165.1 glucosamine-6-phosphate deaminase [Asaia lannensis NBRC 102526]GBQ95618.1 6-phosphogluconolactonase [Asaia lannensis NBRC 102526]
MRLIIMPDTHSAMRLAAGEIASLISSVSSPVLGLATGRTMEGVYSDLVRLHEKQGLDFSRTTTFNLDEYVGLSPENRNSYHYYMNDLLFLHVNIEKGATHLPDGSAADLAGECAAYEDAIKRAGGIDLQLLGIGDTGHIGFNEPPSPFDSRTRCVTLNARTREQNAGMFGNDPSKVPDRALTMGVGTILEARGLLLLALGSAKAAIVAKALEGEISPEVSASAIRLHNNCTVILDKASAALLSEETRKKADFGSH